jgi:hypothetical protein
LECVSLTLVRIAVEDEAEPKTFRRTRPDIAFECG